MPQLFRHRKNRVIQETWNGTGKSAVSFLVRMSTGSQLPIVVDLAGLLAHGWDTSVLTALLSMMVCKRRLGTSSLGVNIRGITCYTWIGWACVVRRRQWLAWINDWAPTPWKCGRECTPSCVARLWSLLEGHTSAECKMMWHVTPCSGKELRMRQERCSQGTTTCVGCWA
jgi:hypothetical protein